MRSGNLCVRARAIARAFTVCRGAAPGVTRPFGAGCVPAARRGEAAGETKSGQAIKRETMGKAKKHAGLAVLLAVLLAGCQSGPQRRPQTVIDGFAQGGTYHIVLVGDSTSGGLKGQLDSLLWRVDNSMSLYNPTSRLSRINRGETDTLDRFIANCIRTADTISRESGGRYDITIKPLTAAYGFTGDRPVQQPNVDSLLQFIGYDKIRIDGCRLVKKHPSVQIDLNSIAQGATADYVARWLDSLGWKDYLVEVGGEIFARGHNAKGGLWRVGIDKPIEGNVIPGAQLQVRIGISNRGLATSGNYRKFYTDSLGRKIVHTFDARTGAPVISNLLSATVVARTAAQADAYGTLCMVMGLNESIRVLESRPDLEAYLVWSDDRGNYRTYMTPGMESLVLQ